MSLLRGQGNHNHILTILVLLLCIVSSAEAEESWVSISDVAAIRECWQSQVRKHPSSTNVEKQIRYARQIFDHPCVFEIVVKRFKQSSVLALAYIYNNKTNQMMS